MPFCSVWGSGYTTLAKKIVTAERLICSVILCDIELQFDIDATREAARRDLASQIEVDVA